jgi:hypothetical protein
MIINRKLGTDKLTKNGGVINGSVTINGQLAVNQAAEFNDGVESNLLNLNPYQDGETLPSHNPGNLYFSSEDGTATLDVLNNVKIQLGEELVIYGKALTGEFIPKGSVVMFAGAQGGTPLFTKADMISPYWQQPRYIVGIATSDIDGNANDDVNTYAKYGYVTWYGRIPDVNTGTFDEGEILYWDPTQSGGLLTNIEPSAPNPKVVMAAVLKQSSPSATNGVLLVRPDFGYRLNQLHDVDIVSPQEGETLLYSGSKWYNGQLDFYTTEEIDNIIGDINTILDNINGEVI